MLWDLSAAKRGSFSWSAHKDSVNFLEFTPDGAALLSGSGDRTVKRWAAATGVILAEGALPAKIDGLALHPEGTVAACTAAGVPEIVQARSSPNNAIKAVPTGAGSSTMRPCDIQAAIAEPFKSPCLRSASIAYCEQVGWYLHVPGFTSRPSV